MNKITEIKVSLASITPGPWGWSESITKSPLGDCTLLSIWSAETEDMELTKDDYKFAAKSPEYITYLLKELEKSKKLVETQSKALEFYEPERKYEEYFVPGIEEWADPDILSDHGKVAREALSHIERMNKE